MIRTVAYWLHPGKPGGVRPPHLIGFTVGLVLTAIVLLSVLSTATTVVVTRHLANPGKNDGYNPVQDQHLPPPTRIQGGPLPGSWSLSQFIVRLHNQIQGQTTNSCVGQTIATLAEIETAEAGYRIPFSSGFIWNLENAGYDQGISYTDAFGALQRYGIPPLANFWPDGYNGLGVYPDSSAYAAAYPHRSYSWFNVALNDQYTIESLIHSGVPLAIALPFHDTLYSQPDAGPVYYDGGYFHFWHSMVIIGYNTAGVVVLNSYPWGRYQQATLAWSYLANQVAWGTGSTIIAARIITPAPKPKPQPKPARKPFPVHTWRYRASWVPYLWHHRLRRIAFVWAYDLHGHLPARVGSPIGAEHYDKKDGLMYQRFFKHATAYQWLDRHQTTKFRQKGRWVR